MALPKLYEQITWVNNTTPALNEDNLNAMSQALDDIDDRVIDLAGTIMEDVPQIIEDMEILEPAIESIDENVARAEAAAESAEQYAEEIAPPIEVVKDFAEIITLEDAINKAVKDLKVKIEPVQDLHGYTKPWVGGAGKNILPTTVADIKSQNTGGTWSGNAYTYNDVTYTIQTDADNNVIGIKVNGTASSASILNVGTYTLAAGTYTISGCPANGSGSTYYLDWRNDNNSQLLETGNGNTYTTAGQSGKTARIIVTGGFNAQNLMFYPMIEAGNTKTSFESYTNICPITGHSEAKVPRAGFNLWDEEWEVGSIYSETGENATSLVSLRAKNHIPVVPSTIYKVQSPISPTVFEYDINKNFIKAVNNVYDTIEVSSNCRYLRFVAVYYIRDYGTYKDDICINVNKPSGSPKNGDYEPYQGHVYTIDLDGTRYGALVDYTRGEMTLTKGIKTIGELEWGITNDYFYTLDITNKKAGNTNLISSAYKTTTSDTVSGMVNGEIKGNASNYNVYLKDFSCADATALVTNRGSEQIVYELATPQTIALTPTEVELLLGYNTLWADTGDLSLTYDASGVLRIANAKLDIDTFKSVVSASSDFADFKTRVAAL